MSAYLRLASDGGRQVVAVSRDTIRCLRELLALAEAGDICGVSYAALHRDDRYSTHSCGEAWSKPVKALGAVSMLQADLQRRAQGGSY